METQIERSSRALDPAAPAILVVDDEPAILSALMRLLRDRKNLVLTTTSPTEALALLETEHVGVVISDYKMTEMDGVEFLSRVKERWPDVQRIMLTGHADYGAVEDVINRCQVFRFILKPWDQKTLDLTIVAALEQYRVLKENEELWALSERQNRELRELNRDLEVRIAERTEQLVRAKIEWERTFDAIIDPVAIVDENHRVLRSNVAYAARAGLEVKQVPGKACHELLAGRDSPCEHCPLETALEGEQAAGVDIRGKQDRVLNVWAFPLREAQNDPHKSNPWIEITQNGTVRTSRAGVCYYRDVTEERRLQSELSRSEKLASLGLFVGGVAHEINNPLGGILMFTQLLLRGEPDQDELTRSLSDIERSAIRCKRIIDSLLSFAHGSDSLTRTLLDCEELIREVVSAFQNDYATGENIRTKYTVRPDTPKLNGDPALLHQLFRNLLQNAEHAMQEKGGTIRIVARPTTWVREEKAVPAVEFLVSDQGAGMTKEQISRIFDPFYSTRKKQGGTGLGLSICHKIVEQHDGHIEVESAPGRGTTFRILLMRG